ncbi:hypothetical protein CCR80_10695 [Rhodothalassium salexigens]|uniref:hypothetical protein n=1 Tax=Rhodothalassium salexigens TaxID=1086 RepID=UPI001914AF06|nr:hypothetical protein [Rhodothalassium salexigens]MBK5921497.1 hypothetical protein [Rhodothalassium salexigens]
MDLPVYDSYAAASAAIDSYLATRPTWVEYWVYWALFAFASSLWFVPGNAPARLSLIVGLVSWVLGVFVVLLLGLPAWGLSRLVLWLPLFFHLARRRPSLAIVNGYSLWLHALMLTLLVTLVLDTIQLYRWLG